MHQMKLALPQWGGRRKGAGRPRTRPRPGLIGPGVPHLRRQDFPSRHPVHVTLRLQPGAGHLRAYRRARLIEDALRESLGRRSGSKPRTERVTLPTYDGNGPLPGVDIDSTSELLDHMDADAPR